MWPHVFGALADEYDRRYGLDDAHLRAHRRRSTTRNAARNPQRPDPRLGRSTSSFADDDDAEPGRRGPDPPLRLQPGHRRRRRGGPRRPTRWLRGHADAGADPRRASSGWGHRTVGLGLAPEARPRPGRAYVLPHVRRAVTDAFDRAHVTLEDLDGFEVHDCFTPTEYLAIDHIGLTGPGESWKAVEDGSIAPGGRLPINPSGGLIGGGHPVGASGIRMLLDATKQVSGTAGDYQVEGARTFGTLNFGGSTATTVSLVVGAVDD